MRHLFLKLKVMRWKGDQKESEFQPNAIGSEKEPKIKTEMLQKKTKRKKKQKKNATSNCYKPTKKIVITNTLYLLHIKT